MTYFLDSVVSRSSAKHDQIILIYDLEGLGYKNFDKTIGKALIGTASKVFVGTMKQ